MNNNFSMFVQIAPKNPVFVDERKKFSISSFANSTTTTTSTWMWSIVFVCVCCTTLSLNYSRSDECTKKSFCELRNLVILSVLPSTILSSSVQVTLSSTCRLILKFASTGAVIITAACRQYPIMLKLKVAQFFQWLNKKNSLKFKIEKSRFSK